MNAAEVEAKLEEYLKNGIANEIFFADEAKALCVEIGNHARVVNAQGFGHLFGSMQIAYSDRQTLCITKMFDPEHRNFPTRSIPATLNLIERHASVWSLPERHKLQATLVASGLNKHSVLGFDNAQLSLAIVSHFRGTLLQKTNEVTPVSIALRNLREARNKVIAHNEAIPKNARTPPTWAEAELLVNAAKDFLTTISFGFLGLYMGGDSRSYYLTHNARVTATELKKLLSRGSGEKFARDG